MSEMVDNRIVRMEFDNKEFEKGIQTSLESLKTFKKEVDSSESYKSLEILDKKIDDLGESLNQVSESTSSLAKGFENMTSLAGQAFMRLKNRVITYSAKIAKSLSVDQFKAGYEEYGLKMDSIKTIMAGTRKEFTNMMTGEVDEVKQLETVKDYLEELNHYADKTIYSFSDMTQNIGKFTNAGKSLKDSVTAIKGISNLSALAGITSAQNSSVMYNVSQSLALGHMQLMDWKSLENANIATQEFKQLLIDTAVEYGTLTKEGDRYFTTVEKAGKKKK